MELTKDECARLVDQGWTDKQIAQSYGLNRNTVRKRRYGWGIARPRRKPIERQVTKVALRHMKAEGVTDQKIGDMFGVSEDAVRRLRYKWKIESNGPKKPARLTEEELSAYKRNGYSDKAIGAIVGASARVVANWRKEYGIDALGRNPKYDALYDAKINVVRKLRKDGLTIAEISAIVEIPPSTINNWLEPALRKHPADIERDLGMKTVYDWIIWYKANHSGISPAVSELSEYCGFSVTVVKKFVRGLAKEGKIKIIERSRLALRFIVVGEQWLPPTGVKIPAAPPKREPTMYRARKAEEKELRRNNRLCDCRKRADYYMEVQIGFYGKKETIPLCRQCAELARKEGETVLPFQTEIAA